MSTSKTKPLALNGVLGALAVICLLLANILPTNRISLYALSSFFISISIIEGGVKAGWIFFVATSLLSLVLLPNKLGIAPYVIFFGLYGIIKFYIERLNRLVVEYILKLVYFDACLAVVIVVFSNLIDIEIPEVIPLWLIFIVIQVVFFVYDFVYTLFINYYRDKIKTKVNSLRSGSSGVD